ncbi:YHYH domain-containing protein [Bacillus sp. FJAT-52991]|uniref:YHYH domain-containing protein n=1 Tax=Bacillus kandeliae TaxID=3129297 RepID=A0ABZ2N2H6_9BACI
MKKKVAILMPILTFSIATSSLAHPGNTDGNGGHYCRTNCAKWGLADGEYHYHNGGGGSSNDSSSNGGGSSSSPSNEPSPAEIAAQKEATDRANGEKEGYDSGYADGYAAASKSAQGSGTDSYNEGYKTEYEKGYTEGEEKLKAEKITAQKEGSALGQKTDTLSVPDKYIENAALKDAFTAAFNKAVKDRDEVAIAKYTDMGYEDGLQDMRQTLDNMKESYHQAYEDGFKKGLAEFKNKYVQQGYNAAFTTLKYQAPNIDDEKYIAWYKEGFESNKEVLKIQEAAFELGNSGEEYALPEKYEHAEVVFKHYYDKGLEQHEKESAQAAAGLGFIGLAWFARRFYVAKKSIG